MELGESQMEKVLNRYNGVQHMKITLSVMAMVAASTALALPQPKKGNPLPKYGISGNFNGSAIMQDHEYSSNLYISPAAERDVIGTFNLTDGVLECTDLMDLRHAAYRSPEYEEIPGVIRSGVGYSPAFDASMGVYLRYDRVMARIIAAKIDVIDLKETHKEIYGEYISAKSEKELSETELSTLDSRIAERTSQFSLDLATIDPTSINPAEYQSLLAEMRVELRNDLKSLSLERVQAVQKDNKAQIRYLAALRPWAPHKERLIELEQIDASLSGSFSALQSLADASFSRSRKLIRELEAQVIGRGNVGIGIYGDEAERLSNAIAESGLNYNVSRLPVFNVIMYAGAYGYSSGTEVSTSGGSEFGYRTKSILFPENTRRSLGDPVMRETDFQSITGNTPIQVLMGSEVESPRSLTFPITLGAFCGYPTSKTGRYTHEIPLSDGSKEMMTFRTVNYDFAVANSKVVSENVVLKYHYYAKAEPMNGECSLNVDKMDSYWRTAGTSKSWSLFGGSKSKSWDDTRRTYRDNMGLNCSITKRPVGANPEASKRANDALEKALYGDMFSMFVMNYAKEFTVEKGEAASASEIGESHPLSTAGTAVMALCGATNVYCAIGGIVMKTLDELGGSKYSGSTSATSHMYGSIKRSFNVDSYIISGGETNLNLKVCIDESQCQ